MDFEDFDTINFDIEDVFKTAMVGALESLQTAYLGVKMTPDIREKIALPPSNISCHP
jgi:hypothetical protein